LQQFGAFTTGATQVTISIGNVAPDATVFVQPKQAVNLSDHRGRPVVLLFFPLAFSGVCTKEICTVAEDYSAYERLGAEVIGISIDSPYVNRKFAEACNARFPIVSDFHREASRAYGVLRDNVDGLKEVSERAAFVLDANGVVRYAWVGEHPGVFPPLEAIKAALAAL
jgi:glutaredoxin-dependent peroxiredoxin